MSKRKGRIRYAPEFRRQMVELVRAGRTPEELAREFEPTANTIESIPKLVETGATSVSGDSM